MTHRLGVYVLVRYLEEEHAAHNNPLRSPMDHGVFVALSSDILPIGPMVGIYAALTRKGEWPKVRASRGTGVSRAPCTRFSAAVGKWVSKLR